MEKMKRKLSIPRMAYLDIQTSSRKDALHLVTFLVGKERFGVEIHLVQEVQPLEAGNWSPVPCTPVFIIGAVNFRGRLYSLMDIGRYLDLSARPLTPAAHVLLVQSEAGLNGEPMALGLLCDEIPRVETVPLANLQPPSATLSPRALEFTRGVTTDLVIVLDLEHLLADPGIIVYEEV